MAKKKKRAEKPQETDKRADVSESFFKRNWITIRSIIIFVFSVTVFGLAINNDYLDTHVNDFFTLLVAQLSNFLINLLGTKSVLSYKTITSQSFSVLVINQCNGVFTTGIFISAVFAFPARLREKIIGILLGFFSIFVINVLRIVGIFFVGIKFPNFMHEAHVWVAQTLVIILSISIWLLWVEGFVRVPTQKADAVHN
jgi:exosortase H (IPTLxxWG-CTERM-specific)